MAAEAVLCSRIESQRSAIASPGDREYGPWAEDSWFDPLDGTQVDSLLRTVGCWLFPESPRKTPYGRAWNIGFRTAHILVTGILVGGHVFAVPAIRLHGWLYVSVATGAALVFLEAFPHARWLYQGRGVAVQIKLLLLCLIPWCWDQRVAILVIVTVLASVGSHMPARFRYYSLIHGRVIEDRRRA